MQVSSINFCARKINGNQYRANYTHQRRQEEKEYRTVRTKYDDEHARKTALRTAVSGAAALMALCSVLGIVGSACSNEANTSNDDADKNAVTPIYQEGEMPSQDIDEEEIIAKPPQDVEFIATVEEPELGFDINLSEEQKDSVEKFAQNWEENSHRYFNMEDETGVPAELIAAIHWRESSGDFNTYLHNGAELGYTINTYFGKRWFDNWEDAAYDALTSSQQVKFDKDNLQTYYDFAEMYNGTGYSDHYGMNSPYVWAGTDKYTCGKYVEDGKFDPNCVDQQPGVAVLLNKIMS